MDKRGTAQLAAAIVNRAVQDWKDAKAMLVKVPDSKVALKTVEETEKFFGSKWYQLLRDITPEIPENMMRRLKDDK